MHARLVYERKSEGNPERLEIWSDTEGDELTLRLRLLNLAYERGSEMFDPMDDTVAFEHAQKYHSFISTLLTPGISLPTRDTSALVENYGVLVFDHTTNLSLKATPKEKKAFAVDTFPIVEESDQQLANAAGYTALAYQLQPMDNSSGAEVHKSLGFIDKDGEYVPCLTIPNGKHPIYRDNQQDVPKNFLRYDATADDA